MKGKTMYYLAGDEDPGYLATPITIRLDKDKFEEFLKNYPRKLEKIELSSEDKDFVKYLDDEMSEAEHYKMVALSSVPKGDIKNPENCRYYVLINYKDCFDSKIEK